MQKLCLVFLVVIFALTACSTRTQDLRIGIISSSINHLPLSYAIERGEIPTDKYRLIKFSSGWEVQEAMISGSIDVAIMPFTYVWNAASKGYPISTVSFFERETDAVIAQAEIKNVSQLNGKKIGLLRASTLDVLWQDYAASNKIDFQGIYFRSPNEAIAALDRKEIEAAVLYVPLVNKLLNKYSLIHWFSDEYPFHPCCDLATNTVNVNSNNKRKALDMLILDLQKAIVTMNNDPVKLLAFMASTYGMTAEECREALKHTRFRMDLDVSGMEFQRRMTEISKLSGYLERIPADYEVYQTIKKK